MDYLIREETLTAFADGFRDATGSSEKMTIGRMTQELESLSKFVLVEEKSITTSSSSTSADKIMTFNIDPSVYAEGENAFGIYITVDDTAGLRNGYFNAGSGFSIIPSGSYDGAITSWARTIRRNYTTVLLSSGSTGYGIYPYSFIPLTGEVTIYRRYSSSNSNTINGTYRIRVYIAKIKEV